MKHLKSILIIIIVAGAIGGIGNYYMLPNGSHKDFTMLRSIVLGIIAAGVLPLFLKLISSNLLDFKEQPYKNYIILISFSLLTGVFADVFLQGVYRKVFHEFENKIAIQDNKLRQVRLKSEFLLKNIQKRPMPQNQNMVLFRMNNIPDLMTDLKLTSAEAKLYLDILNASILVLEDKLLSQVKRNSMNTLVAKSLIEIQKFDTQVWLQKR